MINRTLDFVSWLVAGTLIFISARRWLFTLVALMTNQPDAGSSGGNTGLPEVLLLVPVRNEVQTLPALLLALDRLDYPGEQLTVVFIDDGSMDGSGDLLAAWSVNYDNWHLLALAQNLGKAEALNSALRSFPQGEVVAIYDADERPRPDALQRLVLPFADKIVGGVSGRRAVSNPLASPAASYTTLEGLVYQLVTVRAKDRLNLAPVILGANCAYRRDALSQIGGFKPGTLLEDTDLTVKLARAGWQTHFVAEAVSYHRVPITVQGYWRQHTRWARGFNEVARDQARAVLLDHRLSPLLRLELLTFALGYLDRLALLSAGGLWLFGRTPRFLSRVVAVSLLTPLFQILAALKIGQVPLAMWGRLIWVPLFFGLDVAMALAGFWRTLLQAPQIWEERQVRA